MVTSGFAALATRFVRLLPALLLALLCLRIAELGAGLGPGAALTDAVRIAIASLIGDLLTWLRYLPLLFLVSLPALLTGRGPGEYRGLGATWSVIIVVQAILVQYFLIARVPLGADLYAYSWQEIGQTMSGGLRLDAAVIIGTLLALACLWTMLRLLIRSERLAKSHRVTALLAGLSVAALLFAPEQGTLSSAATEDARNLSISKAGFFIDASLARLVRSSSANEPAGGDSPAMAGGFEYLDERYPFLRSEQTPDTLGGHFNIQPGSPPNLVFVIVEGLGRAFSGPGATLGSFTPFLDELAGKSLYFENFLATQGRTFAVLPSIFGSLPFADTGFNDLGEHMPEHATLLSVLKSQGYELRFYCGTSLDFDGQRVFLQRQGVDIMLDKDGFGPGYKPTNDWGYADGELVSRTLAAEAQGTRQPFVSILQTISTHTPYSFPGKARYLRRFEERLGQLGVSGAQAEQYRAYRDMYATVMYVDDALRLYFEGMKKLPSYGNTIFIVTGDHRLPEIPMASRIDRYHVPFMIHSPLLRSPARIKSVSSHFDITPSLLALLSLNSAIRTPAAVTWIGSGIDMEPAFRNIHDIPIMQTKVEFVDYVSGSWALSNGKLYSLGDGMTMEPASDADALALLQARFAAFRAANDQFARSGALVPPGNAAQLVAVDARPRKPLAAPPAVTAMSAAASVLVREVRSPDRAHGGSLVVEAVFANDSTRASQSFVPLIVLLTADGAQVSESYGSATMLAAGQAVTLQMPVATGDIAAGRYFLAVIPSDPDTGKHVGPGRYRIPVLIEG